MTGIGYGDPRIYVDAICVGCKRTNIRTIPPEGPWREAGAPGEGGCTFLSDCYPCGREMPHNIVAFLHELNRVHEFGVEVGGDDTEDNEDTK